MLTLPHFDKLITVELNYTFALHQSTVLSKIKLLKK